MSRTYTFGGSSKQLDTEPKRAMSEKISADTETFLASGGKVTEIERGVW